MAEDHTHEQPTSVTHALRGIHFPASRADLIKHARHNKADATVLESIEAMPDQQYGTIAEVMKGFGKSH